MLRRLMLFNEKMDEDPAFYKKFSHLIQEAINDFYQHRISELEYLERIKDYRDKVLTKTDSTIPEEIKNNAVASAYYGITHTFFKGKGVTIQDFEYVLVKSALQIKALIEKEKVVNWQNNSDVLKKMTLEIGDYIYDEISRKIGVELQWSEIDKLTEEIVSVAKNRG